jgi:hypothetical protein
VPYLVSLTRNWEPFFLRLLHPQLHPRSAESFATNEPVLALFLVTARGGNILERIRVSYDSVRGKTQFRALRVLHPPFHLEVESALCGAPRKTGPYLPQMKQCRERSTTKRTRKGV